MSKKNIHYFIITHIIVFFLLICFVFFATSTADDYTFAIQSEGKKLIDVFLNFYHGWGGRYSAVVINHVWYNWINGLNFPYSIGLIINLILFAGGIYILIKGVFHNKITNYNIWLITFLLFTGIIRGLPTLDESIYWHTIGISYFTAIFAIFVTIYLLSRLINSKHNIVFQIIPIMLTMIYSSGMEEPFIITNIIIAICFIIYTKSIHKFKRSYYLILVVAVLTFLPALLSQGNVHRMRFYPNAGQFTYSLYHGALYGTRAIVQTIIDPYIWGSILLFSPLLVKFFKEHKYSIISKKTKIIYLIATLLNLYAIPAIHYYGTGNKPVQRLMCLWYIFFFLGIISFALLFAPNIEQIYITLQVKLLKLIGKVISPIKLLLIFSLVSLVCINNPAKAVYDLLYNIPMYIEDTKEMKKSIAEQQKNPANNKVLVLKEFRSQPILLKNPLDPDYGISNYYGFKSLKIIPNTGK